MEEQKTLTQKKIRKNKTRATVFFLISEHCYLIWLKNFTEPVPYDILFMEMSG